MQVESLTNAVAGFSEILRGNARWDDTKHQMLLHTKALFLAEAVSIYITRNREVSLDAQIGYTRVDGEEIPFEQLQREMTYRVSEPEAQTFDGLTGMVASKGEIVSINSPADLARYRAHHRGKPDQLGIWHPTQRPFHSMVAVPLKFGPEIVGILKVENKRSANGEAEQFDQQELKTLRTLGNLFTLGVRLSFVRGLPFDKLLEKATAWLAQMDRPNLYQHLVEFCASTFEVECCAMFLRSGRKLKLVAGCLPNGDAMDPGSVAHSPRGGWSIGARENAFVGVAATRAFLD